MAEHDLTEAEWRAVDSARAAQAILGGDPLVPYDVTGMAKELQRLRAENERLRVALDARILAAGHIEQAETECFACHGTGRFEPSADEDRPALTCAECDGKGHIEQADEERDAPPA